MRLVLAAMLVAAFRFWHGHMHITINITIVLPG